MLLSDAKLYYSNILAVRPFFQPSFSPVAQIPQEPVCENPYPFRTLAPVSRPLTMALTTETKRVVGLYEYTDKDVNQGVTEFLRQMRKLDLAEA